MLSMMEIGVVFSTIILFFFIRSTYTKTREKNDVVDSLVVTGVVTIVCAIVIISAFMVGKMSVWGFPLPSIEPGRYTIVKVVNDYSFVTDRNSRTFLLLKKDAEKDPKFYTLPTNELEGTPQEGGILEVSEVPSSTKMVFSK